MKNIKVINARTHNLKNVCLEIPKEKISVFSGISGSGKSSLAFDTIFAEGQRRYVENLSSYARQVIGVVEKPDVDSIEGIPPAIAIDQKSIVRSPRSTVGTLTEAYDYLRLLYSRFGDVYCPVCNERIFGGSIVQISKDVEDYIKNEGAPGEVIRIIAPVVNNVRGSHCELLKRLSNSNLSRFIIDTEEYSKNEIKSLQLNKKESHSIKVVVLEKSYEDLVKDIESTISKIVTKALDLSEDTIEVFLNGDNKLFSKRPYCSKCKKFFPTLQPRLFSFNSPYGACESCQGLGVIKEIRPEKVAPNPKLTLAEGAIRPWTRLAGQNGWFKNSLDKLSKRLNFSLDVPIEKLDKSVLKVIFYGDDDFEGVINNLEKKYRETDSDYLRQEIEQYMVEKMCGTCKGRRLNKFAESVKVADKSISDLSSMEVSVLSKFLINNSNKLSFGATKITDELIKRLQNLISVGLEYLTLARSSETLSGGEAQRIRLGVQFDSFLSGVLYVLDEPTIGLHSIDTQKIITAFKRLKEEGNTVIIVEHDKSVLESSDYIFDIGPGAGKNGGELIACGTPEEVKADKNSITGEYLSGRKKISYKKQRRMVDRGVLNVKGARHNNLRNLDVNIPLGRFVAVSGVSGSGKSSLVYDIVARALSKKYHRSELTPGEYDSITGFEYLDKVIKIDQSPIGRTPRSNLATYTGIFTSIRELFAGTQEAQLRGYNASQFSFNLKGGRCEVCRGDGYIKIEMYFMPDVHVPCEECRGTRYNQETLEIRFNGKNISQVLNMTVDEAYEFFSEIDDIKQKLLVLKKVGLGYIPLGQSATSFSGGEAQRIKLASELSRPSTGKTIYILDEPTTGLHFEDISRLLHILQELVDRGNTVLVIEHNIDVLKNADFVIDMGPGGGSDGGQILSTGTPEKVASDENSITGRFIQEAL